MDADTLAHIQVPADQGFTGIAVWTDYDYILPVCGKCGDWVVSSSNNYECGNCNTTYSVFYEISEARGGDPDAPALIAEWLGVPVSWVKVSMSS